MNQECKNRYQAPIVASRHILYDWNSETNEVVYGGSLKETLGYTMEEMDGGLCRWMELIHPEERDYFSQSVKHLITKKQLTHLEYRVRKKDGEYIIVQDNGHFITDAEGKVIQMLGFVEDITERKHAEEKLRESEAKWRSLTENSPDNIMTVDANGTIQFINRAVERISGEADVLGTSVYEYVPPEHSDIVRNALGRVFSTGLVESYQTSVKNLDGSIVGWYETHVGPVFDGDTIIAATLTSHDITERKRTDEALQESEERFRNLMEYVPGVSIQGYTVDGKVVYWNKASEEVYGYTSEEALGRNLSDLIIPDNLKPLFEKALKAGREVQKSGKFLPAGELELLHKKGHLVPVYSIHTAVCLKDKPPLLFCIDVDLSERKQAEEKLRRLAMIAEQAGEGIATADLNGNLQFVNEAWARMHGYETTDELIGKHLSIFHTQEQIKADVIPFNEEVKRSGYCTGEVGHVRKDGTTFLTQMITTMFNGDQGEPIGFIGFTTDITERKRAEEELKRAKREAEAATVAKSEFLANMSHEIRTPMNAIIGFSDLLADEDLTDKQKRTVNTLRDSAKTLLDLINDILDYSKIEAKQFDIEIIECSLGRILGFIESIMKLHAEKKHLDFKIVENNGLPERIRTDPTRLRQCLINLVNNAVKFTKKGHVYLNISLEDRNNQPYIRFDVEDTGIGIPEDKQEVIFESFTQADGDKTRKYAGTGLGLTITKRLSELLGGELTVTSEVGKGSIFSFVIPAGLDVMKQSPLNIHSFHTDPGKKKTGQTEFSGHILVAEDARTNQVLIKSLLKRLGLKVTIAEDGNEVVQKALSKQFDLIFMDIEMPNMSGYEATKVIRKEGVKTPIIALTAYAMKGDDERCFAAGCDDYISKPIENEKLLQILSKYLSEGNRDISWRIDSVKSEVEQLNQLCSDTTPSDTIPTESADEQYGESPVDFSIIKKIYDNEEILKETVKVFLEDAPEAIELLAEAIAAKDCSNVKLHAHKLKGLARHVAARKLTDMLFYLETKGREENLEGSEALFADVQTEFDKLKSFLSRPNWTKTVNQ
ncbi:MAG: PAS domain S-box protein [Planctomycetes bacterium]|nr:PAS domain S-box protein [Planctomycetota bacterium]